MPGMRGELEEQPASSSAAQQSVLEVGDVKRGLVGVGLTE